jgi:tRNA(Ile)-lysidine synthase
VSDSLTSALQPLPLAPLVVGFSGGLDSTVLLHALAALPEARTNGLRALHVHHGLHADADAWAAHCEGICADLDIPLQVLRVAVNANGDGPEADARTARYSAFRDALIQGEVLALAQHRDDQAETILLRLLRGAGGDGLSAMRSHSTRNGLQLWRPLLDVPRQNLQDYADAHLLRWVNDPSNADTQFDRNFLRQRVMPLLRERWPHAAASLAGSAVLLAEQAGMLQEEAARRLGIVRSPDPHTLSVSKLLEQSRPWRARVLRHWLHELQLEPPSRNILDAIERELLASREDAEARIAWSGSELRRWRDLLHAQWIQPPLPQDLSIAWDGRAALQLPGGDTLSLDGAEAFDEPVEIRARQGGEQLRLPGRTHRHSLKHALQQHDIAPWQRERLPLLFATDGELLAAGDRLLSARLQSWLRDRGATLRWRTTSAPADPIIADPISDD